MDGKLFLAYMFGALFIGGLIGVTIGQPYPVHLEEWERESFITQLENKDLILADSIEDWEQYAEDVKQHEIDACTDEKRELTDRLASKNEELINLNKEMEKKWQLVIEDLNRTISTGFDDLNALIADTNGC